MQVGILGYYRMILTAIVLSFCVYLLYQSVCSPHQALSQLPETRLMNAVEYATWWFSL